MANKKIRMRPEGVNDYADILHPETSADNVLMSDGKTVEQSINEHLENDMTKAGGTFTGIATAQSNTSYTVRQIRNVILSTSDAVLGSMQDGDIWIKYK